MKRLPEDDWRRKARQYNEPNLTANLELVEGLEGIARRLDRTVGEVAIAWVLRRDEVTSAIVGARAPAQIEQLLPAADLRLSGDVVGEIETLLVERSRKLSS